MLNHSLSDIHRGLFFPSASCYSYFSVVYLKGNNFRSLIAIRERFNGVEGLSNCTDRNFRNLGRRPQRPEPLRADYVRNAKQAGAKSEKTKTTKIRIYSQLVFSSFASRFNPITEQSKTKTNADHHYFRHSSKTCSVIIIRNKLDLH